MIASGSQWILNCSQPMTAPDVTLRFLGGLAVLRGGVPLAGRAAQRRKLALLGLLTTAPGGTASRDRLIGVLWPEADTTAARDLLNTAVYDLRVALGDGAIRSVGDDLSLDRSAVQSDVEEFESATTGGDDVRAVAAYRGPLLDGLFVTGAPEFERWLDGERDRLRRRYRQALERLAGSAPDARAKADALLRLALDDPADVAWVRRAMVSLEGAGDTQEAIRLADRHAAETRDGGADAEVLAHAERLRAVARTATPGVTADPSTDQRDAGAPPALPRPRSARRPAALAALLLIVAVVAIPLLARGPARPTPVEQLQHDAALTTSRGAARHFARGEREYRAGRYLAAVDHYREAVRRDSTFALGHYRLSQSILSADLLEAEASAADARALRFGTALPERYRMLLSAYSAFRAAHPHTAIRTYRSLVTLYPDDIEAWHQLGETLFHYNPRRGATILEAREPFERVIALDPANWSARWHLAHLLAVAGDRPGFDTLMGSMLESGVEDALALEIRALRALALQDSQALRAVLPELATADEQRLFQIAWRSAVFLGDVEGADLIAGLKSDSDLPNALGRGARAFLALARGRWREFDAHLAAEPTAEHGTIIDARLAAVVHPFAPERAKRLESVRAAIERRILSQDSVFGRRLLAHIAAIRGDARAAERLLREADSLAGSTARRDAARALLALQQRRYADAARLSAWPGDSAPWFGWAVTSMRLAGTVERWVHAEALRELGQDSSALGWYGSFGEHALPDIALLAPARLRRGEILEGLGRPAEAAREYQAFVKLWHDADEELQPLVRDVRERVRRLTRPQPGE